jgi:hypothetical protein
MLHIGGRRGHPLSDPQAISGVSVVYHGAVMSDYTEAIAKLAERLDSAKEYL